VPTQVAVLLFDGFDLLDAGGPYEVLLTANRLAERQGQPRPFVVTTVADHDGPVAAYGGLRVLADTTVDQLAAVDVVIVPGTIDVAALAARASTTTASVCTGAFLLAAAGLLEGRTATTHHEDVPALAARPDVGATVTTARWVDTGDVVTVAGLSSGIAGALHLVDRIAGRDLAVATARQIEHAWDPDGADVVPGG
jgi:transcriptional regulator GlxA family with amidase domain